MAQRLDSGRSGETSVGDTHHQTDQSGSAGSIGPVRQGMSKAVKAAGLGLVIFVTVWVVTLWQWYRSQQPLNSEEVATQLILLPVGLTLAALLAWWGAARLRQWLAKPVEAAVVATPAGGVDPAQKNEGGAAAQSMPLGLACILAEALTLPEGDDPQAAWTTLRSGPLRPGLDPQLQDADGMPIFSSRMAGLSTEDWLDAHAEVTASPLPESLLRAMALIEAPLHQLLCALPAPDGLEWAGAGTETDLSSSVRGEGGATFLSGVGQSGGRDQALRRRELAPSLDIQLWVPSDWTDEHRSLFLDWLRHQSGMALDWARASGSVEPRWSVASIDGPEAGWDHLLPRLSELHADVRPRLLLVLAAQSLVDEACVAGLQARGELFTTQHQGGRVPGEGAAGLLLANAPMVARCTPAQHPWLGMPCTARRQRSADRSGRPGSDELISVMQQALSPWVQAAPGASGQGSWWCLSDADHRPGRASELFEAFQALQPDADAMQSVLRLGDVWGELGIARALLPVALAASVVRQGAQPADDATEQFAPALVGLTQGSHRRWAIPVWPASLVPMTSAALHPPGDTTLAPSSSAAAPVAEPLAA